MVSMNKHRGQEKGVVHPSKGKLAGILNAQLFSN